jgi:hypothetical protein
MIAGQRRTFTWPVTIESGTVASLNAVGLLTRIDTNTTTQLTATPTASVDPLVGTIAVTVELADTVATGNYMLRLDVNDGAGDLDADQFAIFVTAASAQRVP